MSTGANGFTGATEDDSGANGFTGATEDDSGESDNSEADELQPSTPTDSITDTSPDSQNNISPREVSVQTNTTPLADGGSQIIVKITIPRNANFNVSGNAGVDVETAFNAFPQSSNSSAETEDQGTGV